MKRVVIAALLAVAGAAGVAATFGTRDADVSVHVTEWEFSVTPDTVPAGTVVFHVVNDGIFPHDFTIKGKRTPALNGGERATLTVELDRPGLETYWSTLDDVDREMVGAIVVTGTPPATTAARARLPLRHVADVPLPGGGSRFDYQSLDERRNRLYVAHLGDGSVVVFDVATRRVVKEVHDVDGVHGVLAVPALNRVFAAATDAHELVAIRESNLKIVKRTRAGSYPDGLAYDPVHKHVFVSDKDGDAEVVVTARGARIRTIALGGEAGNVKYDPVARRMLVAVAGREQLVSIDPRRNRIVARRPLDGCSGAHGVQLDAPRRLAFVACERNARLLVVDLRRGRVTGTFTVGDAPDVLALDPGLHRLYVAAESGVMTVLEEQGRTLRELARDLLAPTAHSVAVDPRTHLVYVPLEDVGGKPVLRILASN